MRHPDGTYDLTVDDIHEIRVENSKITKKMSNEELKEYYDNAVKKFFESSQNAKILA